MHRCRTIGFVVALLATHYCVAQPASGVELPPAVQSLLTCSSLLDAAVESRELESRLIQRGVPTGIGSDELDAAGACLDDRIRAAVQESQSTPALAQAVKDYFTAAQTFRSVLEDASGGEAAFSARVRRAAEPHVAALQRVRMEVMLNPSQPESAPEAEPLGEG